MAFGFGFSLPNLRKAGGSFVPVVLVTETWSGSGAVNGKVPTTGGGTWLGTGSNLPTYSSGIVNTDGGAGQFVHSATYQNVSILGTVYPDGSAAGDTPLYAYARLNGTPSTFTNGYIVEFGSFGGGSSPHVRLNKVVGGVNTELFYSYADPVGQPTSVTISGSLITIRVNGSVAIQLADTSISAAGYWGYGCTWADNGEQGSRSQVGPVTIQTA